jgi:SAM-dependent methyltransferase
VSFWYRVLYRLGITPWDRDEVPPQVKEVAADSPRPGRALDIGCGTGRDAVYLTQEGWAVTGVDAVPQALDAARERGKTAGVEVEWVEGDVTRLEELGLREGYDLVVDRGCFHGLPDDAREACARGVNALTAPNASLLMFAFAPGFHGPAPRGIDAEEIQRRFGPEWEIVSSARDEDVKLAPWLKGANPSWHRLRRRG